jgi:hypothetical protein
VRHRGWEEGPARPQKPRGGRWFRTDALDLFLRMHAVVHSRAVAEAEGGWSALEATLDGAGETDLRATPQGMNSVAWALWHTARIEDVAANVVLAPGAQALDRGGFGERMRVPRRDIGVEMSKAEMAALSRDVDLASLLAYRDAVGLRTREVAASLAPARWEEVYGPAEAARVAAAGALLPAGRWLDGFWTGKSMTWFLYWVCTEHSMMHLAYSRMTRRLPA